MSLSSTRAPRSVVKHNGRLPMASETGSVPGHGETQLSSHSTYLVLVSIFQVTKRHLLFCLSILNPSTVAKPLFHTNIKLYFPKIAGQASKRVKTGTTAVIRKCTLTGSQFFHRGHRRTCPPPPVPARQFLIRLANPRRRRRRLPHPYPRRSLRDTWSGPVRPPKKTPSAAFSHWRESDGDR